MLFSIVIFDEPYVIGGVQKRWQIHCWQHAVSCTWRDCPRTEGNIQALLRALDGPDGAAIRAERRDRHDPYYDAGLCGDVLFRRRRFGRVFDRFKI